MNQYIHIRYKPSSYSDPNFWYIWFKLNQKEHREKTPSLVYSDGGWRRYVRGRYQKHGYNFDWNKS